MVCSGPCWQCNFCGLVVHGEGCAARLRLPAFTNPFVSRDFRVGRLLLIYFPTSEFQDFWAQIEQEWAECEKKFDFYPFDGVNDPYLDEDPFFGEDEEDWSEFEDDLCSEVP